MTNALTPRMLPALASNDADVVETPRSGSPMGSVDESSIGGPGSTATSQTGARSVDARTVPSRPPSPAAESGLGSLATEQQLIDALRSKDRLFVLGLGQDIESFIQRLQLAPPESLIDIQPLGVSAQSKFQRMLVYKAAEWYGLKAVAGGDGQVHVGLAMIGLHEASSRLRLSTLVPREPSPPQMFRIMRRNAPSSSSSNPSVTASTANGNGNVSRSTSVSGDNEGSERERKTMTIEEREREYAKVRMRIFKSGEDDEMSSTSGSVKGKDKDDEPVDRDRGRQQRAEMRGDSDDEDPVSRHAYTVKGWEEPIFASVYRQSVPPPPASVASSSSASVPPARLPQAAPPGVYGHPQQFYGPPGPQYGLQTPTQLPQQFQRLQGPHPYPPGGRQQAWEPASQLYPPQQFFPEQGEQWGPQYYPAYQENYGYPPPLPPYGYAQSQYSDSPNSGNVASPIPTRPSNYHHYSATSSSSISSRSIDGSRPHSRGSTTSSRSGGARMGAMYPATAVPGPGQRQRGMSRGMGAELRRFSAGAHDVPELGSRRERGESPGSTTSSSSRRRSIPLQTPLPGQHPLPNRPDWSANNVPYQPSPRPPPAPPTTADFPPLRGSGTDAVPMQSERAKVRPTPGVWDGTMARKALQHSQNPHLQHFQQQQQQQQQQLLYQQQQHQQQQHYQQQQYQPQILHNPMYQYQPQPPSIPDTVPQAASKASLADDSDFPRRPIRSAGTLYDPSGQAAATATPPPAAFFPPTIPTAGSREGLTNEEIMEAKLAALAVSTGVVIGPPPNKQKQVQSYARIVRRE